MFGQLGFCQGNSGDPIFEETFGAGTTYGPQLPAGTTTYSFVGFSGPQDGEYSIGSSTFSYGWNMPSDHTPNDNNGKALIVNASFTAGEFYNTTVSGLCENTTYEFSSWLINILPASGCGGSGIPVNVNFEIWDITDSNLLAEGDTGNIFGSASPTWNQYGLVFQTLPGQTSVILKMKNNGIGGCGNDLAIDDIVFKSCGDSISSEDSNSNNSTTLCSSLTPYSETITAIPDNTVFSNHFYQWQSSYDGIIWTDIPGETSETIAVAGITETTLYRAKVAEFESNLNNIDCITFSDIYQFIIIQAPEQPSIQCWESTTFNEENCEWEISGTQPLEFRDEFADLCQNETISLEAISTIENPTYQWDSGEQSVSINVNSAGTYEVEVTDGCFTEIITFTVTEIIPPVIDNISSEGSAIIIDLETLGNYQYSLDGIEYQFSNVFSNQSSGLYTIFVRSEECDFNVTQQHVHFFIPKFMTPNGDGVNDFFAINSLEFFTASKVFIFDRYGKLLFSTANRNINWDGTFNGLDLPSSDYWYVIEIDGQRFTGHFALKR